MKVILAMVVSADGKSTKGDLPPKEWASREDQIYLSKLIRKQKLIVMGSNTYLSAKKIIKLSPKTLRVVLTKSPKKYKKDLVAGQLEFSSDSPTTLVKSLEHLGYKQMLLLGGIEVNTSFFKANLINELWLTIEPKIFGKGKGVVAEKTFDINLKLKSLEKLNKQ